MVLTDTSVLIDYLKGTENENSLLFRKIFDYKLVYGILRIAIENELMLLPIASQ